MQYRITLESDTQYGKLILPESDEPEGLDKLTIFLRRDDQFHGIFPQASTKLRFICSGREYIKGVWDSVGIIADIQIRIDFVCAESNQWEMLLLGKLDLTEVEFTYKFAEVPIKPTNCLDLFMERLDTVVNLYDEPCFTELTYDGTAARTRYEFCPYFMLFKSKTIIGISQASLQTDGALGTFQVEKAWRIECNVLTGNPLYSDYNVPAGAMGGGCPSSLITPTYPGYAMCVQFPIRTIVDDIGIWNEGYTPKNNQIIWSRDCGDNDNPSAPIPQCELSDFIATSPCICSVDNPINYEVTLNLSCSYQQWVDSDSGNVEVYGVKPELIFEWGSFSATLVSAPTTYMPASSGCYVVSGNQNVFGSFYDINYSGVLNVPSCDVNIGDKMRIFIRYEPALKLYNLLGTKEAKFWLKTVWKSADITVTSLDCIGDLVSKQDTRERVFAVHESFSRVVEHYTNNCLRVKSCYFGRPNSMQGANDYDYQNPTGCDPPQSIISQTFDPIPFQTGNLDANICEDAGCGAWTVITSGIILRAFGRSMFVTFNELYEAMDCVFNIGVGYIDSEPDTLRIENKEYFYQSQQVIRIDLDEYKSKFTRRPATEYMIKRFITGYAVTLKDEINTIDEFNTQREYVLLNTKIDGELAKQTEWIASGYTIEWQRRSRYSADAEFDDNKFIIATERFVGQPFPADGMYYPELGVDNPSSTLPTPPAYAPNGIIDPATIYNWRLSPYYNAVRWASYLRMSTWKQSDELLRFSKGETNYNVAGNEPGAHYGCDIDINYNLPPTTEITHAEDSDIHLQDVTFDRARKPLFKPETVTFEFPLSFTEFLMIKQNPYGVITVNGEDFYIKEIAFQLNKISKFTLLKA